MTAKVKPGWGKWIGRCEECAVGHSGAMERVAIWVDIHNKTHHLEDQS